MIARGLIDITMAVHWLAMVYIVFGGFLVWRWRRTLWLHLAFIAWAVSILVFPLECPLTAAQNYFRAQAGQPPLANGFIDTYITGVLYPASYTHVVQVLVGLIVLGSWVGAYAWHRRTQPAGSAEVTA